MQITNWQQQIARRKNTAPGLVIVLSCTDECGWSTGGAIRKSEPKKGTTGVEPDVRTRTLLYSPDLSSENSPAARFH